MNWNTTHTLEYVREVADSIRKQITPGVLFSLGAHDFEARVAPSGDQNVDQPALTFKARILPMTAKGERATAPRIMQVLVKLNGNDYYDVRVSWQRTNRATDAYGAKEEVLHFTAEDIDCASLARLMLSLDYDGETVTNPRYA